jgi:hypothetical protein
MQVLKFAREILNVNSSSLRTGAWSRAQWRQSSRLSTNARYRRRLDRLWRFFRKEFQVKVLSFLSLEM